MTFRVREVTYDLKYDLALPRASIATLEFRKEKGINEMREMTNVPPERRRVTGPRCVDPVFRVLSHCALGSRF